MSDGRTFRGARKRLGQRAPGSSSDRARRDSRNARLLAAVAILALGAFDGTVLAFAVANTGWVLVSLAGLALVLAAGWWALTRRAVRRALAIAGLLLGAGVVVAAIVGASSGIGTSLLRLAIVLCLLLIALGAGRGAMERRIRGDWTARLRWVRSPLHPVLICNPWSGGGKVQKFNIVELATSLGVETLPLDHGLDLEQLARHAVQRGADCLAMAGGDGSQALVASIAVEHDLPFVCVAAGTRNHFALDLGLDIDDPRSTLDAFKDGIERRVDYATVNGRLFVNNVSLGLYATIVQEEGYRESKLSTTTELLPQMLGDPEEAFDLQFVTPEGVEVDGPFLIQVSNNPYVMKPSTDLAKRRQLDSGKLGVLAVATKSGIEAVGAVTKMLGGRMSKSRHAFEFTATHFQVRSRSGKASVGVDGEALRADTPLDFEIHPRGLRLLVPKDSIQRAMRRQARDLHASELLTFALRGDGRQGQSR